MGERANTLEIETLCVCEREVHWIRLTLVAQIKFCLIKIKNPLLIVFKETCLSLLRNVRTFVFLASSLTSLLILFELKSP